VIALDTRKPVFQFFAPVLGCGRGRAVDQRVGVAEAVANEIGGPPVRDADGSSNESSPHVVSHVVPAVAELRKRVGRCRLTVRKGCTRGAA
jgi:hypothetical protein